MDRIERHDFVNAVLLAVVLLGMAFGLVYFTNLLFESLDEGDGIVTAEGTTTETVPPPSSQPDTTPVTEPEETETSESIQVRPPEEIVVRVANGGGSNGVAGRGTDRLTQANYDTLGPKNSSKDVESSIVYYIEGYQADAEVIANVLGLPVTSIGPMPADPGTPVGDANIVVVLGGDSGNI